MSNAAAAPELNCTRTATVGRTFEGFDASVYMTYRAFYANYGPTFWTNNDATEGYAVIEYLQQYAEKSVDLAMPVTFVFLDYRQVDQAWVPYRIEKYLNSTLVETILVSNVEFNPAFSGGIFER